MKLDLCRLKVRESGFPPQLLLLEFARKEAPKHGPNLGRGNGYPRGPWISSVTECEYEATYLCT
jgi:hypothetical protein